MVKRGIRAKRLSPRRMQRVRSPGRIPSNVSLVRVAQRMRGVGRSIHVRIVMLSGRGHMVGSRRLMKTIDVGPVGRRVEICVIIVRNTSCGSGVSAPVSAPMIGSHRMRRAAPRLSTSAWMPTSATWVSSSTTTACMVSERRKR